jgi:hypothetical protein
MVKWSDIQNETNPKARRMALSDALRHASDDEMQQLLELASQDPDAAVRAVAKNWDVLQERLVTPPADETDPPPPRLSGPVRLPNVQVFMLRTGNAAYFQGQVARPSDFGVVKNTLGSIVTALLLFACGVGLLLYGGNDGLTWLLLRAEGMSTTATVTNRNGQSAGESSFVYTVTYRYQVNERMYTIIAYRALKALEGQIRTRLADLGGPAPTQHVSTRQCYGFDTNPFAVELAKVTLMIAKKLAVAARLADKQPVTAPGIPANYPNPSELVSAGCITPAPLL